ncbi:hypothetical protein JKP88DRAFT_352279 [Tribonema minus]|uniref:Uncharacterized protein n=1 Tax=Tribonema minus TaxID=303371 RepID=A0A835ZEM9_9STRA|nr:hypothetical protein JKP88DRAFT_352279 [Tribonema minus]
MLANGESGHDPTGSNSPAPGPQQAPSGEDASMLELCYGGTPQRLLLRGPPRSGRSSLLFDHAYRLARRGLRVTYICMKARIERQLPLQCAQAQEPHDAPQGWDPAALERIGMKYVASREDLLWFLGSVQMLRREAFPCALLVDDIDVILGASAMALDGGIGAQAAACDARAALYALAMLEDAARFLGAHVVAAAAAAEASLEPGAAAAFARYFPQLLRVAAHGGGGGGGGGSGGSGGGGGGGGGGGYVLADESAVQLGGGGGGAVEYRLRVRRAHGDDFFECAVRQRPQQQQQQQPLLPPLPQQQQQRRAQHQQQLPPPPQQQYR